MQKWFLVALVLGAATGAAAHPLAPSLLELRESAAGRFEVTWKTPRWRPPGEQIEPVLPDHCRAVAAAVVDTDDISVRTRWSVDCGAAGLVGEALRVESVRHVASTTAVVRLVLGDGRVVQTVLAAGGPEFTVPAHPSRAAVARDYLFLGMRHILSGPDHLLFVFGLFLLAGTLRRLLGTVTSFTLGHSVTLTLAALEIITPPSGPIEVGIALSVFALAVELARPDDGATLLRRFPWVMSILFGLLHGLGFAAGLREAGLPSGEIPLALASFNGGIEMGQVLVVTLLLGLRSGAQRLRWGAPVWVRPLPVYLMGSLAAFWSLQRAAAWLR